MRLRYPSFLVYERAFKKAYRFVNPYRLCKEFAHKKKEALSDVYGETPLPVLAEIARQCGLKADDTLLELGCGRGRGAFFLSHLTGCRTIGIDWLPFFIDTANAIAESTMPRLPVQFRCQDMQNADFSKATAIFLYGTCLSDEAIFKLIERFKHSPSTVRIITISYPLADYSPYFRTIEQFSALFPWGEGEIYIQRMEEINDG